jgi:hypothetical protein
LEPPILFSLRSWVENSYANVRYFNEVDKGRAFRRLGGAGVLRERDAGGVPVTTLIGARVGDAHLKSPRRSLLFGQRLALSREPLPASDLQRDRYLGSV